MNINYKTIHKISINELFKTLNSKKDGLTKLEVQKRQKEFGLNKLSQKKEKSKLLKFLEQFKNFFSMLLLIGAALSFVSENLSPGEGSIYIAWTLLGVAILNAAFTFFQEYKAEEAMKSFKNLISTKVKVLRNGVESEINSEELVPGDIINLQEGDKISADARIIESFNLKVDHSALTGESEPQLRSTKVTDKEAIRSRNMVFSGTLVQMGSGKAIVISTGDNTKIGKIAKLTSNVKSEETHMQQELKHFVKIISTIAIILGISFFVMGLFTKTSIWLNLVYVIGIIVANVPEGLLPTVTLTLSIAAQKMAKKNALVKNIEAIETLGSLTVICSDKTGTLTQNELNVRGFYLNNNMYEFDKTTKEVTLNNQKVPIHDIMGSTHMEDILICCNNSQYDPKTKKSFGDPTEICLKEFISNFTNVSYHLKQLKRIFEVPFDSVKKYMITAHQTGKIKKSYLKGAPEVVLNKCSKISINRKESKLNKKTINNILKINEKYSSQGYRVLAFGIKKTNKINEKELEKDDYTFYGLVIMQDPPRPEVRSAVEECQSAGIKIIVISGDQGRTVESIARQTGIVRTDDVKIMTSEILNTMSDQELKEFLKNEEIIFARSLPEDKLRIVTNLQEMGEIVAVTGDGVNDAPALKRANVGVAMGKCGTEVAKESADIILLDDNFATITKAIKYGRTVYDNIQSFIIYILTSNIPEIVPFLLFIIFAGVNWPLALTVLLILAIDLGTDMIPAISLGVEDPSKDIMEKAPRDPKARLCNTRMIIRSYAFQGPIETIFAFLIFFHILSAGGWKLGDAILSASNPLYQSAVTAFFTTIIVFQIFNLFACKTSKSSVFNKNILKNRLTIFGILTEIILILALITIPALNKVFGTSTFPISYVPWMIAGGALLLLCEELRKFLYRHYGIFKLR